MKRIAFTFGILSSTLLAAQPSIAASWIGKTAIVLRDVTSEIGADRRTLKRGDGVFQNELIKTGSKSRTQVLFRDETVLSIGADSAVLIDKFVYDPNRTKTRVVLNTFRGSFRFITGSGPSRSYKIKTPVATIGIRGTIANWTYDGIQLRVWVGEGAADLCLLTGGCVSLRPGMFAVTNGRTMRTGRRAGTKRTDLGITEDPIDMRFSGTPYPVPSLPQPPAVAPPPPPPPTPLPALPVGEKK